MKLLFLELQQQLVSGVIVRDVSDIVLLDVTPLLLGVGTLGGFIPNTQENQEGPNSRKTAIIDMNIAASEFHGKDKICNLNFKKKIVEQ